MEDCNLLSRDALSCHTCIYQLHNVGGNRHLYMRDANPLYGWRYMRVVTRRMGFVFSPLIERSAAVLPPEIGLAGYTDGTDVRSPWLGGWEITRKRASSRPRLKT
jgi:hypothetical protein